MAVRSLTRILLVVAAVSMAVITGCGSDTDSARTTSSVNPTDVTDTGPGTTSAVDPTDVTDTGPGTTADATAGGAAMTGSEICERLSADTVAGDLDLDVTAAVPDDSATPQCAYEYTSATGGTSNLTVAFMRPEDVGGRTGSDAYEFTLDINRAFAGEDEEAVDAGDEAVRLDGPGIQVGIVRVGDQVYTLLVPGDAEAAAVATLIATMATTLG
jgi:hypothetical protein